ncbi:MAG: 2-oxoglutarate and iron-dependent oxygenase domain-containing protein [Cypionkella sp.]|nr:2-oxoglutarate and iron-dependent oxygenase domain-containing protein [Cypionkella sp.]
MIPRIDAEALINPAASGHDAAQEAVRKAVSDVGFMTLHNTPISAAMVGRTLQAYRAFFAQPHAQKAPYDMARTGSNRGWGALRQ